MYKISIWILFTLNSIYTFCQQIDIVSYDYSSSNCEKMYVKNGAVTKIVQEDSITNLEINIVEENCLSFTKPKIFQRQDTLFFNFDLIENLGCWCTGREFYEFNFKISNLKTIPTRYVFLLKDIYFSEYKHDKFTPEELNKTSYIKINDVILNLLDENRFKQGIWVNEDFHFDSIFVFTNNKLITSFKNNNILNFLDSTIYFFEDNTLIKKIEKDNGYEIEYTFSDENNYIIEDKRFYKKDFDRVLKEIKIVNNHKQICWLYIKKKRIEKIECE